MPIIKSAKKRVRTATKAAVRNSKTKRTLKGALKAFHKAVTGGEKDAKKLQAKAQSALDTAAKKATAVKKTAVKAVTKKAPAKKPAAKKTVAKKK